MTSFGCNALKFVTMNNEECKVRLQVVVINSDNSLFYSYNIQVNKCSGSNINDSYGKSCVSDVAKNMNVKAFNLMSKTNETRFMERDETCKCKCRLDVSVCNNKQ